MSVSQPKYQPKKEINFPISIMSIKRNSNNDKISLANLVDNVNNNFKIYKFMFDNSNKKMRIACDSKTLGDMVMEPSKIDNWLNKNEIAIGVKTGKPVVMMCERMFG